MAKEVSTNGRKKVETLMKEFNDNFPYLSLSIGKLKNDGFHKCNIDSTLAELREKKGNGEISFIGSKHVKTLEREFLEEFGLQMQICITEGDGRKYYSAGLYDEMSLTEFNKKMEQAGCKKGNWKWE